jgi:hypothetical protein
VSFYFQLVKTGVEHNDACHTGVEMDSFVYHLKQHYGSRKKVDRINRTRVESETALSRTREVNIKIVAAITASSVEASAPKVSVASAANTGIIMVSLIFTFVRVCFFN